MSKPATDVLDRILHLASLVNSDLARFETESGLTTARVHVLWLLGESGPCTQQHLAQALAVSPRNVTGLVDALVASGHVGREPHPTDRRATLVTPTPTGSRVIGQLVAGHQDLAQQLFDHVPARRLAAFVAVLDDTIGTLSRLVEQERG